MTRSELLKGLVKDWKVRTKNDPEDVTPAFPATAKLGGLLESLGLLSGKGGKTPSRNQKI